MNLLVIGWDGASKRHVDKYNLSFWDSLNHTGKLLPADLFYKASYISSANAWTTLTTGASFQQHRILGFVYGKYTGHPLSGAIKRAATATTLPMIFRRVLVSEGLGRIATEGGRMEKDHIQSTDIPFKRVWELLPGQSLVFGLPLTYPVWDSDGILVSGIPAPTYSEATRPLVAPKEIEPMVYSSDFTGYYVDENSPVYDSKVSEHTYTEAHLRKSEQIVETYLDLYNDKMEEEPRFGFLMLRLIDDVLHATAADEHIEAVYKQIDSLTAKVVDEIDPDNVLILSDHGMRPTSRLRVDADLRMDHDTSQGIWGSTADLDLHRQIDFPQAVLRLFGQEQSLPVEKQEYDVETSPVDGDAVHARLKDLGYA